MPSKARNGPRRVRHERKVNRNIKPDHKTSERERERDQSVKKKAKPKKKGARAKQPARFYFEEIVKRLSNDRAANRRVENAAIAPSTAATRKFGAVQ